MYYIILIVSLIWYVVALCLAREFALMGMEPTLVLIVLSIFPVVNAVLLLYILIEKAKKAKKEGRKLLNWKWIGSFSETFKKIRE